MDIAAQKQHEIVIDQNFQKHFDEYGVKGSVIIFDASTNKTYYYDKPRTQKRFSPASTFKIFNSLVGLETAVIPDTSFVIQWDSVKRGNYLPWNRSNSLNSAFKYSVVWYYQELARRVGSEKMQYYLSLNKYGNESIKDSIDAFWLSDYGGKLEISQQEQIGFLNKLYHDKLAFSKRSQQLVKTIMLMESNEEYSLSAKTGMCSGNSLWYGWYVGWIEKEKKVYFFATHMECDDNKKILSGARKNITLSFFQDLNLIKK